VLEEGSAERDRMRAVRTKMTIPPVIKTLPRFWTSSIGKSEVKQGQVGCHGHCMSGPYALAAAAR
jgi:carboxymethylenebutenolidase